MFAAMSGLTLEVVEGPDAGRQVALTGPVEIGRDPGSSLTLNDQQVSRRHVRVTPNGAGAVVEDLGSSNGTFVNRNELMGTVAVAAGDELIVGVSVIALRSRQQVAAQPSAVRPVPPALAIPPTRPTFTDPPQPRAGGASAGDGSSYGEYGKLANYTDSRVKLRARLAPLALFLLVTLIVVIFFATR